VELILKLTFVRKVPEWTGKEGNTGDDGAGIVEAVGDKVSDFSKGDRVAGFHEMGSPGGTYGNHRITTPVTLLVLTSLCR